MKKRLIEILIISTMLLVGCGNDTKNNVTNNTTNNTSDNTLTEIIVVDTTVSSADDALQMLKDGNNRFLTDTSMLRNVSEERRDSLKDGQNPYVVIVSCSDSRVTPTVFHAGLGEIFDVRLAGNVVDDDALGSIEYAVQHLNTPLVIVMGHQSCGAVTATYNEVVKGEKVTGNMKSFVEKITPSINKKATVDDAIHNNINSVVKEVSEDEEIKALIDQGKVNVIGAYYDLDGKVTFYE